MNEKKISRGTEIASKQFKMLVEMEFQIVKFASKIKELDYFEKIKNNVNG